MPKPMATTGPVVLDGCEDRMPEKLGSAGSGGGSDPAWSCTVLSSVVDRMAPEEGPVRSVTTNAGSG